MNIVKLNQLENGMVVRYANTPDARWIRIIAMHDAPSMPSRQAHIGYLDGGGGALVRLANLPYEVSSAIDVAQRHMAEVAEETGAVTPSGREVLRGYSIRYNIVTEVDGQGEECGYCNWHGKANPITHQVYGTTLDGETTDWSCCGACVLHSIDEVEDIDQDKAITVEKVQ